MKNLFVAVLISLLAFSTIVHAQAVNTVKDASGTVGTSYKAILPTQSGREYLFVENESTTNYLAITIDNTVPVINGAGSITLAPYQTFIVDPAWVVAGGVNVIGSGSGSGTVYTIKYR